MEVEGATRLQAISMLSQSQALNKLTFFCRMFLMRNLIGVVVLRPFVLFAFRLQPTTSAGPRHTVTLDTISWTSSPQLADCHCSLWPSHCICLFYVASLLLAIRKFPVQFT
eukprot:TRINITY_DN19878_c0_g1_i1.p1 TRINITY_DN19878_c0_g1~~TRINITY_DN19878_c0_g1_i1.p1  ORF type:complete len:111 (-),score=8.51 TRINITY_DN19878_c0_g1_i1:151-483(-)